MAQIKTLNPISYDEIISSNNRELKVNLIPAGYPDYEISKGYDFEVMESKIDLASYEVEKLINNI